MAEIHDYLPQDESKAQYHTSTSHLAELVLKRHSLLDSPASASRGDLSIRTPLPTNALHPPRPRLPLPTLVASTLAGLALLLTVGLQSPAVSVGLRWTPPPRARGLPIPKLTLGDPILNLAVYVEQGDDLLSKIVAVLIVLVTLALLAALLLWILRITRRPSVINVVGIGAESGAPSEADAKIVRSGLAAALHILNSERHPGNAVVQAWQGLQDAAAEAGVERRPAETASEFTARILYRSRGSAEPIGVLLSLYQRVRFGHHSPTMDEIATARDSLNTLVELWQADFRERRPPRISR